MVWLEKETAKIQKRKGEYTMFAWFALILAAVSTIVCLFLWFREVRRVMWDRKSTVDSAASQLSVSRERASRERGNPGAEAVLARSERIYRQSVELYDATLKKPAYLLPALLMGFRFIP